MTTGAEEFEKTLPRKFKDRKLLKTAFVHRSYLNERAGAGLESYERLEFLGDAVLSVVISDVLYGKFPETSEGRLTTLRAKLVNRRTLARLASDLGLGECLFLGRGEKASGGSENTAILAGVFESVIGAAYLDWGFPETFSYIEGLYEPLIDELLVEPGHFGFKPRLQEVSQRIFKEAPTYRLVSEEGPPHRKTFEVEVIIQDKSWGSGTASKKKDAEQLAAGTALKALKKAYKESFNK